MKSALFISLCRWFCPPIAIFLIVSVLKPFARSLMNLCLLQCSLGSLCMNWPVVCVRVVSCLFSAPLLLHSMSFNPLLSVSCMKVAHSLHAITWYASLGFSVDLQPKHRRVLGIVCCFSLCVRICCLILLVTHFRSFVINGVVMLFSFNTF